MSSSSASEGNLLRHTLATMVYRGGKTLWGAPEGFADFSIGSEVRTPGQILAHIGDLLDWAVHLARGEQVWHDSTPLPWPEEIARFHASAAVFDAYLAAGSALAVAPSRLFQGPIADAITHFGQLAMLRRLAGSPVRGENYFKAEIVAGRVGPAQAAPRLEFE